MVRFLTQLSTKEEEMFRNMIRRLNTIVKVGYCRGAIVFRFRLFLWAFQAAQDMDVRIMVDAEQTYFQPAISRITLEFMRKYNKDKAIVFNTYQCYLREAFNEVTTDLEQAKRQNFYFGAKLVRGAYIEQVSRARPPFSFVLLTCLRVFVCQERARAAALGYSDPTNANYEATSEMYHKTLTECLRRIKELKDRGEDQRKIGIMVASHNEDTVRYAIQKMKEIGVEPEDKVICFGQLLAMCDYITFPLGEPFDSFVFGCVALFHVIFCFFAKHHNSCGGSSNRQRIQMFFVCEPAFYSCAKKDLKPN